MSEALPPPEKTLQSRAMLGRLRHHLSPATVIALVALFVAMGGSSFAAPVRKAAQQFVSGRQIKDNSVTGADVRNESLTAADFAGSVEGERGPSGPQGPRGLTGAAGDKGVAGLAGPTGRAGENGPIGPAGPTGEIGPAGPAGPRGANGPAGPVGPLGEIGPVGPMGPRGDIGPAGAAGPAGEVGPAGAVGPTGAVGPAGPPGAAGATNVSVRTTAVTTASGEVHCAEGERATGGGFDHGGLAAAVISSAPIPATAAATPTGWKVVFSTPQPAATVFAVCAAP